MFDDAVDLDHQWIGVCSAYDDRFHDACRCRLAVSFNLRDLAGIAAPSFRMLFRRKPLDHDRTDIQRTSGWNANVVSGDASLDNA